MRLSTTLAVQPHTVTVTLVVKVVVASLSKEEEEVSTELLLNPPRVDRATALELSSWCETEIERLETEWSDRYGFDERLKMLGAPKEVEEWLRNVVTAMCESPDAVVDLVEHMGRDRPVDSRSFLGQFVHKNVLAWQRGHFDTIVHISEQLSAYVSKKRAARPAQSLGLPFHLEDLATKMLLGESTANEKEIKSILAVDPELAGAHLIRLVACLRNRDFQGSLDSLHRYFDYALSRGGPRSADHRTIIQYATLSLVCVHVRFGHAASASLALNETIQIAQQSRDHACVTYAMAWLHHLESDPDALERCAARIFPKNSNNEWSSTAADVDVKIIVAIASALQQQQQYRPDIPELRPRGGRRGGGGPGYCPQDQSLESMWSWLQTSVASSAPAIQSHQASDKPTTKKKSEAAAISSSNDMRQVNASRRAVLEKKGARFRGLTAARAFARLGHERLANLERSFLPKDDEEKTVKSVDDSDDLAAVDNLLKRGQTLLEECGNWDPVPALSPLMRCVAMSERYGMDSRHAMATALIATAQVRLGDFHRAQVLLLSAMPKIVELASLSMQGRAWLSLCECQVAHAQNDESYFDLAQDSLERAFSACERANDLENLKYAYYLSAHLCNALGDIPGRERAAKACLDLDRD